MAKQKKPTRKSKPTPPARSRKAVRRSKAIRNVPTSPDMTPNAREKLRGSAFTVALAEHSGKAGIKRIQARRAKAIKEMNGIAAQANAKTKQIAKIEQELLTEAEQYLPTFLKDKD